MNHYHLSVCYEIPCYNFWKFRFSMKENNFSLLFIPYQESSTLTSMFEREEFERFDVIVMDNIIASKH